MNFREDLKFDEAAAYEAEIETALKAAGFRCFRINGPFFLKEPDREELVTVPAKIDVYRDGGKDFFAVMVDGQNVTADPFEEFGYRSTVGQAISDAVANGYDIDQNAGTATFQKTVRGSDIDGTGKFLVSVTDLSSPSKGGRMGGGWD